MNHLFDFAGTPFGRFGSMDELFGAVLVMEDGFVAHSGV